MKENLECKEIAYKAQSIETIEFGILSMKHVTATLKEVFHAEPPKHKDSARCLIFKPEVMERMKDNYEMDMEIEVLEGDEVEAHEALEALSRNIGLDKHMSNSEGPCSECASSASSASNIFRLSRNERIHTISKRPYQGFIQ